MCAHYDILHCFFPSSIQWKSICSSSSRKSFKIVSLGGCYNCSWFTDLGSDFCGEIVLKILKFDQFSKWTSFFLFSFLLASLVSIWFPTRKPNAVNLLAFMNRYLNAVFDETSAKWNVFVYHWDYIAWKGFVFNDCNFHLMNWILPKCVPTSPLLSMYTIRIALILLHFLPTILAIAIWS